MFLLITYILIALGFSFLCSIAEAVLLSVSLPYVSLLEKEGHQAGRQLRRLKDDINKPLAAILTLNTVAHTVGAAGAGAQAAEVFGSTYVGVASAVLTFLILVFSEIIPKTLGAYYWRQLAPITAYALRGLVWILYPFVKMTELLTRLLTSGAKPDELSRKEFLALTEVGGREGVLAVKESVIMQNLLKLRDVCAEDAMTPRPVVFAVPEEMTVEEFFAVHAGEVFSRIPVYRDERENIVGFVLRNELLQAQGRDENDRHVAEFVREIPRTFEWADLSQAFDRFLKERTHIMLVTDEYGGFSGILTLEDTLETLLGREIVDELDTVEDMQALARDRWHRRREKLNREGE